VSRRITRLHDGSPGVNQTDIARSGDSWSGGSRQPRLRVASVATDRYDTAAKIALRTRATTSSSWPPGRTFPRRCVIAYLAQQLHGGSILLTRAELSPGRHGAEMRLLGPRTVVIVGGTSAISPVSRHN